MGSPERNPPNGAAVGVAHEREPHQQVRQFLADADLRPDFAQRALARIHAHDEAWGESYRWASLSMLVSECAQEAEDLAAWAGCAAARLQEDVNRSPLEARARALLTAATQRAGEADTLLCQLRRLLEQR